MVDDLAAWALKAVVALIAGFVALLTYMFKTEKDKITTHEKEIADLKAQSVSEDKVREIVTDCFTSLKEDMKDDMQELKIIARENMELTRSLQVDVAQMQGYHRAQMDYKQVSGSN